jgi:hypothetical protein
LFANDVNNYGTPSCYWIGVLFTYFSKENLAKPG